MINWQVLSDDYESQLIAKATTIIEVPQGYTDAGMCGAEDH